MAKRALQAEKYTGRYWASEIKASADRHNDFSNQAKESINQYGAKKEFEDVERKLNVWWFVVQTLLPAYFSQTPKAEVNLRRLSGNQLFQHGALLLERNVQYSMDEHFDFEHVGVNSALQFLLTGRAVIWARYDPVIEENETEFRLIKTPEGLVDGQGKPFAGEESEVYRRGRGYFSKTVQRKKLSEKAVLDVVQYCDYFESDGRNEAEIEWRARRAYLSEDDVVKLFGGDIARQVEFNSYPEVIEKRRDGTRDLYEGKAEFFEIWCEESQKLYWVHKNGKQNICESGDPPVTYEGFYPCSVIHQNVTPDSNIPVSDFVHVRDQVLEVERLTTRIHAITQAIRTNHVYDKALGSELEQLLSGDLKMIPAKNWPQYKGRGGLAAGVESLNIDPFVKALQVVIQARESALTKLFESVKASDLLRGASDPTKTATANRIENHWSSLGLKIRQNMFAKFISDGLSKLGCIISQQFSPETILEVADAQEVFNGAPHDYGLAVCEVLRSDSLKRYRIKVAADSMVQLDELQERQDAVDLMASAGSFFEQMQGMIEKYPPLARLAMRLMQFTIRRYKGGKELEGDFIAGLKAVEMLAQQQQQKAMQQPPDPTAVAAQTQMQIAQVESQDRQAKMQAEFQLKKAELDIEFTARMKELELRGEEIRVQIMKLQAEAALRDKQVDTNAGIATLKADLERRFKEMEHTNEQQRIQIEALNAAIYAGEVQLANKKIDMQARIGVEKGSHTKDVKNPE